MSITLGPMAPSLTGSSTCMLLTVSVPLPALMSLALSIGDGANTSFRADDAKSHALSSGFVGHRDSIGVADPSAAFKRPCIPGGLHPQPRAASGSEAAASAASPLRRRARRRFG